MEIIKDKSSIAWSKIGISGSILVKLHTSSSDIDVIIYGSKIGYQAKEAMKELLEEKNNQINTYDLDGLKDLFDFRSKDTITSFEDFVRTDSRKVSHGKYMDKDFFIRFVKDQNEIREQYGDIIYKPEGNMRIKATIIEDFEAIFTPCHYNLANVKILDGPKVGPIEEIVSFRGRFCEQAKINETVIAQGKLERVQQDGKNDYYRLLLGNKPSDYMILK